MGSPAPIPGKCGAKRRRHADPKTGELPEQEYCKNKPVPGKLRCKYHGGNNSSKHGLYARTLQAAWPDDGLNSAQMFAEAPATVGLEYEIKLLRVKIARYQLLLARGEKFFEYVMNEEVSEPTDSDVPLAPCAKPTMKSVSVEYLLERVTDQLRRLVKTQHDMLPGAEVGGNLRVAIVVVGHDGKERPRVPMLADDENVMAEIKDMESARPKALPDNLPVFDGGYEEEDA